jgi:hypothetical protein
VQLIKVISNGHCTVENDCSGDTGVSMMMLRWVHTCNVTAYRNTVS